MESRAVTSLDQRKPTSKTPLSMVKIETSKVPPPRSKTRMFFSAPFLSRPYANAAAVGSFRILATFNPAITPACIVLTSQSCSISTPLLPRIMMSSCIILRSTHLVCILSQEYAELLQRLQSVTPFLGIM